MVFLTPAQALSLHHEPADLALNVRCFDICNLLRMSVTVEVETQNCSASDVNGGVVCDAPKLNFLSSNSISFFGSWPLASLVQTFCQSNPRLLFVVFHVVPSVYNTSPDRASFSTHKRSDFLVSSELMIVCGAASLLFALPPV